MKNTINRAITLLTVLVALFSFSTCKKTDTTDTGNNNTNNNTNPIYYFTYKVNGVAKDLKSLTCVKDDVNNFQTLFITCAPAANVNSYPNMKYTLSYKGTGFIAGLSYTMNDEDLLNFCEYTAEGGNEIFRTKATPHSNNGGLTITFSAIDSCATGTFSGTMQLEENTNTITITDGKFRIRFNN